MDKKCVHCAECEKELYAGDTVYFDEEDGTYLLCKECAEKFECTDYEKEILDEESIDALLDI